MVFEYAQQTDFLQAPEQYLLLIASCLPNKINPHKEPLLATVAKQYPQVDIYNKAKRIPGSYQIVGDPSAEPGTKNRPIILLFCQFYDGKVDYPNDNKSKRVNWFVQALDELSELRGLENLAVPSEIARDGGGNWSQYYTCLKDFCQTLELKIPLTVRIYDNPVSKNSPSQVKGQQICLLNCVNLMETVDLKQIYLASRDVLQVDIEKPTLEQRESITQSIKRTRVRLSKKSLARHAHLVDEQDLTRDPKFDILSSSSEGDGQKQSSKKQSPKKQSPKKQTPQKITPKQKTTTGPNQTLGNSDDDQIMDQDEPLSTENQTQSRLIPTFPSSKKNSDWDQLLAHRCFYQIHPSWRPIFERPEVQDLLQVIDRKLVVEIKKHGDIIRFRPDYDHLFRAFNICPLDELKVVILGQDPYFSKEREAMGLSFSVPQGVNVPASLQNIFKEIKQTYSDYKVPSHGDLTEWAEQGVLLLNSALTVRFKDKESHMSIWKPLTDKIIEIISKKSEHPIIFMLWGRYAQGKEKLIDCRQQKHLILKATHPSPLGANQGGWFGCKHFDLANQRLMTMGLDPIDWQT